MGATLPLLARHAVRDDCQITQRIGFLYAMNTAGAVGGALATAFWLLPALGLSWSVRVAALVNVLVFGLATWIARRAETPSQVVETPSQVVETPPQVVEAPPQVVEAPPQVVEAPPQVVETPSQVVETPPQVVETPPRPIEAPPPPLREPVSPEAAWILPLMLASGAISFFHEVLWTRMLSHVLGSSLHAFGVMVASFLAGIATGGAVGSRIAPTRKRAHHLFAIAQLGCAVSAACAFLFMDRLMPTGHGLAATAAFGATLLLPLTFFIGTTFPLAVRILAEGAADAAAASARVYAWNTVGAIVGSLAAASCSSPGCDSKDRSSLR